MSSKDERIPVQVIVKGKFTVTIFDIQAYENAIERYKDSDTGNAPAPARSHRNPLPVFEQTKRIGRFNWNKPLAHYEKVG